MHDPEYAHYVEQDLLLAQVEKDCRVGGLELDCRVGVVGLDLQSSPSEY